MRIEAEAEQAVLQRFVRGQRRHLAAMDDAAIVHDANLVADLARDAKVLLDEQDRDARRLDLVEAGESPLVGSSISNNSRGSTMARAIDSICFWPPERAPARDSQNFLSAGKKPKIQARRPSSSGPSRAPRTRFSLTERSENTAIVSGA
jgi:hypothetical protein